MFTITLALLDRAVFLVIGLLGLTACLAGSRLLRFWLAIAGLQTGFYLGLRFGMLVLPNPIHQLILAVLAAVLLGGLFSILSRVGSILAGAAVMALLADQVLRMIPVSLLHDYSLYIFSGLMLLGVLLGALRVRGFLILASAFHGGWLASYCTAGVVAGWPLDQAVTAYDQLRGGGYALLMVGTGVLMIIGSMIQFRLGRPKKTSAGPSPETSAAPDLTGPAMSAGLTLPEAPVADSTFDQPESPVNTSENNT